MRRLFLLCLGLGFLAVGGGCNVVGLLGNALPTNVEARYKGLPAQTVGVMVWADRGIRIDFPSVQGDVASAVQTKLQAAQSSAKPKELEGTTFPVKTLSIVRFQKDHPELEGSPVVEVAPKFPLTRLIYVEVQTLSTRSAVNVDLYRGSAIVTVRVVEIANGKATVVFDQPNVSAVWPPKSPDVGVLDLDDSRVYAGTVDGVTSEIAKLFFKHEVEK